MKYVDGAHVVCARTQNEIDFCTTLTMGAYEVVTERKGFAKMPVEPMTATGSTKTKYMGENNACCARDGRGN